ncbi:hypothetical protein ABPG72_017590 [Tetrahymena utriculariae]
MNNNLYIMSQPISQYQAYKLSIENTVRDLNSSLLTQHQKHKENLIQNTQKVFQTKQSSDSKASFTNNCSNLQKQPNSQITKQSLQNEIEQCHITLSLSNQQNPYYLQQTLQKEHYNQQNENNSTQSESDSDTEEEFSIWENNQLEEEGVDINQFVDQRGVKLQFYQLYRLRSALYQPTYVSRLDTVQEVLNLSNHFNKEISIKQLYQQQCYLDKFYDIQKKGQERLKIFNKIGTNKITKNCQTDRINRSLSSQKQNNNNTNKLDSLDTQLNNNQRQELNYYSKSKSLKELRKQRKLDIKQDIKQTDKSNRIGNQNCDVNLIQQLEHQNTPISAQKIRFINQFLFNNLKCKSSEHQSHGHIECLNFYKIWFGQILIKDYHSSFLFQFLALSLSVAQITIQNSEFCYFYLNGKQKLALTNINMQYNEKYFESHLCNDSLKYISNNEIEIQNIFIEVSKLSSVLTSKQKNFAYFNIEDNQNKSQKIKIGQISYQSNLSTSQQFGVIKFGFNESLNIDQGEFTNIQLRDMKTNIHDQAAIFYIRVDFLENQNIIVFSKLDFDLQSDNFLQFLILNGDSYQFSLETSQIINGSSIDFGGCLNFIQLLQSNEQAIVNISNSSFKKCKSKYLGGAISGIQKINVVNSNFTQCNSQIGGALFAIQKLELNLPDDSFQINTANLTANNFNKLPLKFKKGEILEINSDNSINNTNQFKQTDMFLYPGLYYIIKLEIEVDGNIFNSFNKNNYFGNLYDFLIQPSNSFIRNTPPQLLSKNYPFLIWYSYDLGFHGEEVIDFYPFDILFVLNYTLKTNQYKIYNGCKEQGMEKVYLNNQKQFICNQCQLMKAGYNGVCQNCQTDYFTECYGDYSLLKQSYWRSLYSVNPSDILYCSNNPSSCQGVPILIAQSNYLIVVSLQISEFPTQKNDLQYPHLRDQEMKYLHFICLR